MTRQQIIAHLGSTRDDLHRVDGRTSAARIDDAIRAIEALPEPPADPGGMPWPPGRSVVAVVPGDCLISMKAAIDAGARIIIEPANPESEP